MNVVDGFLMVTVVVGALWWVFATGRFPRALAVLSFVSLGLAAVTLVAEGLHWQLVPWQLVATVARPPPPCDGGVPVIRDDGTESSVAWAYSLV